MHINFFLNYDEDKRSSMMNYGLDHVSKLKKYHKDIKISYFKPKIPKLLYLVPYLWRMRIARYLLYKFQIKKLNKVDIAHVVDHQYAHLVNYINATKKIITVHDLFPIIFQSKLNKKPFLLNYSLSFLNYFDKIIAISTKTKKDVNKILKIKKDKIEIFYQTPHLFPNSYNKKYINKFIKKKKRFIIITYAQTPYKNFKISYKLFKRLNKKIKNLYILNFGKTNIKIKNEHKKQIIELPYVNRKQQNNIYRSADLLLFPSYFEGYGLPCVEAIKCGLPVVSSNISSIKEIMNKSGLYCTPNNIRCYENKILKLYNKKNFKKITIKRLQRRSNFFNEKKYFIKLKNFYTLS